MTPQATSHSARTRTTFISRLEGRLLITRKLSGNFPNYEMVMPKDNDKTAVFDLEDMKGSVRRVALMADERSRSIRLTVREGEVELSARSSDEGEGSEVVPADYSGEEVQLGFNWQYLQDFLNTVSAVQSGEVENADAVPTSRRRFGQGNRRRQGPRPRIIDTDKSLVRI